MSSDVLSCDVTVDWRNRGRLRCFQEGGMSQIDDVAVRTPANRGAKPGTVRTDDVAPYGRQIVPLKWFNWIPSLGGRSVRPILDRIDATITRAMSEEEEAIHDSANEVDYTFSDFLKEFINPKNGAQPTQDSLRMTNESTFTNLPAKRVILVAHSAGGWICRILLGGKVPYDGRVYAASRFVTALVTLGTPHVCTDKLTKRNMDFVNENYPGAAEAAQGVHYICVAGKFVQGEAQYGGLWKDFAWQSYELCCGKGDVWGDGVIPLDCAIGLEGAQHVILEGVEHFPSVEDKQNRKWYGSMEVMDRWFPLLLNLNLQENDSSLESIAIQQMALSETNRDMD
ncbi:hypothetical protein L7F22_024023 [Adiantum nelumboides]|nr:hypothetical protein [Adiantum nelumboides]